MHIFALKIYDVMFEIAIRGDVPIFDVVNLLCAWQLDSGMILTLNRTDSSIIVDFDRHLELVCFFFF